MHNHRSEDFGTKGEGTDQVIVLANPKAGARSGEAAIGRLAELLGDRGYHVDMFTDPDRMGEVAARAHESGRLRTVVAAGGDGTVRLAASRTDPSVPISVLPLGTENLLSKYLSLPAEPDGVCQAITHGGYIQLDAGWANERMFLIMLSCGFDADVVRRLHDRRRGHIHHLSYARPIVESALQYEHPELRVYCHGTPNTGRQEQNEIVSHWAFVFNLPSYAAGLDIAADANGADGRLDVCAFLGGSVWHALYHLSSVMLGQHRRWGNCVTAQATKIRIDSEGRVPYQLDGDPGGFLPVEIEVMPRRVSLVVPLPGRSS
jgi:diacylglycerol kinase family enzyme